MKITTLEQLEKVAQEKKAIIVPKRPIKIPAAFAIGMPGRTLLNLFRLGMYVYKKRERLV